VLDGVDDRFADRDADPVDGILVEAAQGAQTVTHDLNQVERVEHAEDREADEAARTRHVVWLPRYVSLMR
jgi:hypothetical protein